jgi:hypothetical protein
MTCRRDAKQCRRARYLRDAGDRDVKCNTIEESKKKCIKQTVTEAYLDDR